MIGLEKGWVFWLQFKTAVKQNKYNPGITVDFLWKTGIEITD